MRRSCVRGRPLCRQSSSNFRQCSSLNLSVTAWGPPHISSDRVARRMASPSPVVLPPIKKATPAEEWLYRTNRLTSPLPGGKTKNAWVESSQRFHHPRKDPPLRGSGPVGILAQACRRGQGAHVLSALLTFIISDPLKQDKNARKPAPDQDCQHVFLSTLRGNLATGEAPEGGRHRRPPRNCHGSVRARLVKRALFGRNDGAAGSRSP
jgi:hypothetical protein